MKTVLGRVLPRHAETSVRAALEDTRVVLVNGARQSGKSTLVRLAAGDRDAEWRDLDIALTRNAALGDPDGFVDGPGLMVIDEVQRAPDLLLAIMARVDADPTPGCSRLVSSCCTTRTTAIMARPRPIPPSATASGLSVRAFRRRSRAPTTAVGVPSSIPILAISSPVTFSNCQRSSGQLKCVRSARCWPLDRGRCSPSRR